MILALFDFDGTITTHETMPAFVKASTSRMRLITGYAALWPLVLGYKFGLVPGTIVRSAIVKAAYSGIEASEIAAIGRSFSENYLENCLRPEAMQRIAWHQSQGHEILIVSGGLDAYLRPWAERHNLELVCSSLEQRGSRLTGSYLGSQCVREAKVAAVRSRFDLSACHRIFAYGDTIEDEDLLELATDPFYKVMPQAGC